MTVTVSSSTTDTATFGQIYHRYYINKYVSQDQISLVPHSQLHMVGGAIPGLDASLALIGAGTSLCQGIKNLRHKDSGEYKVTTNINNCTLKYVTIASSTNGYPSVSSSIIEPAQNISVTYNSYIGKIDSSDYSTIKIHIISEVDPDQHFCIRLYISGQSDTSTSRQIRLNGVSDDDSSMVKDPNYNAANENITYPIWKIVNDMGTFYVKASPVCTSKNAVLNISILEYV